MTNLFASLGKHLLAASFQAGDTVVLFLLSLRECVHALAHPARIVKQMKRVGNDTLIIASGIALFIGMVIALQVGSALSDLDIEAVVADIVAYGMIKEFGPVITALLLAARIGASIAAEVGTMQINEEIDALHTLGISPVRYLAMPRLIACVTMLPILVIYASLIGIIGGGLVANTYFDMGWRAYFDAAFAALEAGDLVEGILIKPAIFGAIVAMVACQRGFRTRGGAEGVGNAITSSVVTSFICIVVSDYFVTRFML